MKSGRFKDEIAPVTIKIRKGDMVVDTDEYPKAGVTWIRSPSCARPSTRKAPSPRPTPPASTTAPPRWC